MLSAYLLSSALVLVTTTSSYGWVIGPLCPAEPERNETAVVELQPRFVQARIPKGLCCPVETIVTTTSVEWLNVTEVERVTDCIYETTHNFCWGATYGRTQSWCTVQRRKFITQERLVTKPVSRTVYTRRGCSLDQAYCCDRNKEMVDYQCLTADEIEARRREQEFLRRADKPLTDFFGSPDDED